MLRNDQIARNIITQAKVICEAMVKTYAADHL